MPDLGARELWAVGPLIALVVALGVYPKPALDIINPAVRQTLVQVHSTDPVPPHPGVIPQLISGMPQRDRCVATTKSQHAAISQPEPTAGPVTTAIAGIGRASKAP